jgi:hypothetical protein
MDTPDFEAVIQHELSFFPSEEMKLAFQAVRTPPREVIQTWIYGKEPHHCWIVAGDSEHQIVYCRTGFGPGFPWSWQSPSESRLGMDSQWCAYLYEAFAPPGMWKGEIPEDFMLMGPGERENAASA